MPITGVGRMLQPCLLIRGCRGSRLFLMSFDRPSNQPAYEDCHRQLKREIDADGDSEYRCAEAAFPSFEGLVQYDDANGPQHADADDAPWKSSTKYAVCYGRHEGGLWCGEGVGMPGGWDADTVGLEQERQHRRYHHSCSYHSHELHDLLFVRSSPDDASRL